MITAISNLGAGGTQDISLSDTANAVLYGTFAVGGMFAGGVCNLLGPRLTLFIGSLGYALVRFLINPNDRGAMISFC